KPIFGVGNSLPCHLFPLPHLVSRSTCQRIGKEAIARLLSCLLSCHITRVHAPELRRLTHAPAETCFCRAHAIALKECRAVPGLAPVCGCLAHGSANVVRSSIFASFDPTSSHLINKP
ncbi:hypothetical protein HAX54_016760, partial [Datura stramonium]|nr:hypothetical protein [Datura stramonium]